MRFAVIGVGSNSCRLLIASCDAGQWKVEHHDIRATRLGESVSSTGKLAPDAMTRTLEAVREFAVLGGQADRIIAIGTSALRDASNASDFASRVREVANAELRILTGEEEARASFAGALWALDMSKALGAGAPDSRETLTVSDIGGGSTEIAVRRGDEQIRVVSAPLGALRLTERFFKHDPPGAEEISASRTAIRLTMEALDQSVRPQGTLVFVGGTADTAARMLNAYEPAAGAHVARVKTEDLLDLLRLTSSLPMVKRKRLHALPEARADIFPAGLIILDEIARQSGAREVLISESDLLLGYLISHAHSAD
jgi:exopolyphosphatase / guanosine-5'-triphosphate,3'-diphosphate pyrophosphatase